jgi:hypothetical protein
VLALQAWRPSTSVTPSSTGFIGDNNSTPSVPTHRDVVLGLSTGAKPSTEGRAAILEAGAHVIVCAVLQRNLSNEKATNMLSRPPISSGASPVQKDVDRNHESNESYESGADIEGAEASADDSVAHQQAGTADSLTITMVAAAVRFLSILAIGTGVEADSARDALMSVNAHKVTISAMEPLGSLRQTPIAMVACMDAVRQFAGSGEFATSLMRKDLILRQADVKICSCMRAHTKDVEVQRSGCAALRNLSFGGREEGDVRRNHLVKNRVHVAACTALRLYLAVNSDPTRQALSVALHEAALGVIRNISFGAGTSVELRRQALFRERAPELVVSALTVTNQAIEEAVRRSKPAHMVADAMAVLTVGIVALGNLFSGTGYLAENRRHFAVLSDSVHRPIIAAMDMHARNAHLQHACMVALGSLCLGSGEGADEVRSVIAEYELPFNTAAGASSRELLGLEKGAVEGSDGGNIIHLTARALRRFAKELRVEQVILCAPMNVEKAT